jgi:hypothetical protein
MHPSSKAQLCMLCFLLPTSLLQHQQEAQHSRTPQLRSMLKSRLPNGPGLQNALSTSLLQALQHTALAAQACLKAPHSMQQLRDSTPRQHSCMRKLARTRMQQMVLEDSRRSHGRLLLLLDALGQGRAVGSSSQCSSCCAPKTGSMQRSAPAVAVLLACPRQPTH